MNMSLKNTLKMALKSILANKMRTLLTMLGIIIGVFSVIVMVSLGQGATADVTESIEDMGSNLLSLSIFDQTEDFDNDNIEELAFIEGVEKISPSINRNATIKYGTESEDSTSVVGVNENYAEIQNYAVSYGRFINPIDVDFRNKVAVIGYDTVYTLFGEVSPIDKEISVNGEKYTVVGVLEEKESTMMGNNNELVIIPYTTGLRQFKSASISSLVIQGNAEYGSEITQENVEGYLLEIYEDEDSYKIFNQEELLSTLNEITATLTLMLGGIAGISLVVGGIGIMNIMLVTVSERTREIGIRKAIGAKRSNILTQFLIESSVISCLGGLVGIGLGIGATNIISNMMDIKSVINLEVVTIAFAFSLFVGIFFGMYPANKASKLKPVDALRYE
jgi:putative ABC transport system permease protein